jgi:hypothetical protein
MSTWQPKINLKKYLAVGWPGDSVPVLKVNGRLVAAR